MIKFFTMEIRSLLGNSIKLNKKTKVGHMEIVKFKIECHKGTIYLS
jgi:hypothetical protein